MVERERRIQEELKEEEKFAKEREQMALQYEQESRKQMEREVFFATLALSLRNTYEVNCCDGSVARLFYLSYASVED